MDCCHVIILCDKEQDVRILNDYLEQMNLITHIFTDSKMAMDLLGSLTPCIIVIDRERFGSENSQLYRTIREKDKLRSIPIICLNTQKSLEYNNVMTDPQYVPDAVLIKPVHRTHLLMTMHSMMRISDQYNQIAVNYEKSRERENLHDNLLDMLVHDMRQPIQSIYGYCSFLEGMIQSKISKEDIAFQIKNHAYRLNQMLQNFLDMGRLESNNLPLFWEELHLGDCIRQCYDRMQNLAVMNDVKWELICEDEDFPFMADTMLVERILDNLVNNAVKFSQKGQNVILRAMGNQTRDKVIFSMEDNGPGIPDTYKKKIFDKFVSYSLHLHNKPSVGLGLAFCKLAAQAHNGDIWVEDNPKGGSIFKLVLPAKQYIAHTPFDIGKPGKKE